MRLCDNGKAVDHTRLGGDALSTCPRGHLHHRGLRVGEGRQQRRRTVPWERGRQLGGASPHRDVPVRQSRFEVGCGQIPSPLQSTEGDLPDSCVLRLEAAPNCAGITGVTGQSDLSRQVGGGRAARFSS